MHESITKSIRDGRTVTLVGVLVNTILIILKLMTGIFGNSQALIADAVHSISDLFTDIAVLIGLQIRYKPPDEKHHFGHARVETERHCTWGSTLPSISTATPNPIPRCWR
ncbi:MAG: cation transporter [Deltaproteobacteria bacterium]|nr:cation transporter [Deltaproteobacteria bacterium]